MFKKKVALFAVLLSLTASIFAQKVTVKKDDKGWKLYDGKTPVEVKGVVWAFTPIGESYNFDLFGQSDEYIKKMIDTDMPMLKAMGVNAIRCFTMVPPKWVEYIYTKYGIYSIVNHTLGRYGISVNGTWFPQTDYSDVATRAEIIRLAKQTAEDYKDTKGVLMYMWGNESNYGLVWSSTEIEDLPVGEQATAKAVYLYSLFGEVMDAVREIDPNRPQGIVNGDVQYLDLIKTFCPSMDILGVNAYRGYKFYDSLYENVRDALDKPIVLTEHGADAFNDILKQEDQAAQMTYLKSQWQEIYEQSYGKGKCQNIIGGFVFEWIDEWWKRYQVKNLDVHDDASWANAGYDIDYKEGVNNMSEEWFGLCAQSTIKENDINVRIPRAAYYMFQDAWKLPLYDSTQNQVASTFSNLETAMYLAKGNEKSIKQSINENKIFQITVANASVTATTPVYVNGLEDNLKDKKREWTQGFRYKNSKGEINEPTVVAEANLGVQVQPFEGFTGDVTIKAVTGEPFTRIGDHYSSYYEKTGSLHGSNNSGEDKIKYVDVYSSSFTYQNKAFDLNGYYHVGHGSFEGKGDPFSISAEGYDIIGYDTYGSKAPIAIEYIGHGMLQGLEVIGGPEIVGGAAPKVQANYFKWFPSVGPLDGVVLNLTGELGFGQSENVNLDPYNGYGSTGYKFSVYGETYIMPWFQVKGGLLTAGSEKIGAYYVDGEGEIKQIDFADTLGGYLQVGTNMFQHSYIYFNTIYRGVVADTNAAMVRGSFFTADSGSGNRFELQLGSDLTYGNFTFKPVLRARAPVQKPMGRSLLAGSPFVVGLGNRQSVEAEFTFCYDPEGGTWFHEWNSDDIEGAPYAFNITGLYQAFAGRTDNTVYKSDAKAEYTRNDGTTVEDYYWNEGGILDLQKNLYQFSGRVVLNPRFVPGLRVIATAGFGKLGASTGTWTANTEFCNFYNAGVKARYGHWIGSYSATLNGWGTEGWYRDFNITFPLQYTLDVAYSFKKNPSFLDSMNRLGVKVKGVHYGKYSSAAYGSLPMGAAVDGAKYLELTTYFNIGL